MDFYDNIGKMAIGSRLRRLSETITADAAQLYNLYGVNLKPKWFPVFYSLSNATGKSITEIADEIGHSHPSVSKIIREMAAKGLIAKNNEERDGRKNRVKLSAKGKDIVEKIQLQYKDVSEAIESTFAQTNYDLWKAIEEWEILLHEKSLLRRVEEIRKKREHENVTIIDFEPRHKKIFKELNAEWIDTYFVMEPMDLKSLDHPQEYVINNGGAILMANYNGETVGTCALVRMKEGPYDFEVAKMAVSPGVRGKGIGWILGEAIIEKARQLGAKTLYIESNTKLKSAISLYYKLGFKKIIGMASPYERCNIQMLLKLE